MTELLIVDDNQQSRYLLQVLLTTNGFTVEAAANGVEALEQARRRPPEMIISDILMPVMDGFALCRAWKADKRLQDIPFVFYTATYTDSQDEEFALRLGAARFIVKPSEPENFLALLQEISGEAIINDIGLAALALLTAASNPRDKDVMIPLTMNMLTRER